MKEKANQLLEIVNGQLETIEYNNINDLFHKKMDENNISYEDFKKSFDIVSEYLSEGYEDDKENADLEYIDNVINTIKSIMDIANTIKGYQDMGDINLKISKEDFHLENEGAKAGYEMDREKEKREAR